MYKLLILSCIASVLIGCSTPPKPPTVDGTERHAINSESVSQSLSKIANQPKAVKKNIIFEPESRTVSIHFPFNGTKFKPTNQEINQLLNYLKNVSRVSVRGRTDNKEQNEVDEKIALKRALAAKRYLIDRGIPSIIISVNYVSAGDYVADNYSKHGRPKNRRVDIEIFRKIN